MKLTKEELIKKISDLIKLGKEGKTWDFKRQWYEDKGKWVKHILAMANNETSEDSYIIIGVGEKDEEHGAGRFVPTNRIEKDYKLKEDREKNGFKQQSELTKWLRELPFADKCPDLDLELDVWVSSLGCLVDVIIVRSTSDCPYYLSEDYPERKCDGSIGAKDIGCWVCKDDKIFSTEDIEGLQLKDKSKFIKKDDIKKIIVKTETESEVVRANDVYTRIKDMSAHTFNEGLAGFGELEKLYRKRFGLDLNIEERFNILLANKDDWWFMDKIQLDYTDEYEGKFELVKNNVIVNKYCPDFYIDVRQTKEPSPRPLYGDLHGTYTEVETEYIRLFFKNSLVSKFIYDYIDRYQASLVRPAREWGFWRDDCGSSLYHDFPKYHYYYFVKNDILWNLDNVMLMYGGDATNESLREREEVQEYVIYFENEGEKNEYDKYLKTNIKIIAKDIINLKGRYEEAINKGYKHICWECHKKKKYKCLKCGEETESMCSKCGEKMRPTYGGNSICIYTERALKNWNPDAGVEQVMECSFVPRYFVKKFYEWKYPRLLEEKEAWESDLCGYYRSFDIFQEVVCRNKRFKQFRLIKHTEQVSNPYFYLVYLPTESKIISNYLFEVDPPFDSKKELEFLRICLELSFPSLSEIEGKYECICDRIEDTGEDFCFVRPKLDNSQSELSYCYFFNNSPERKINAILSSAHLKALREHHKYGRIVESYFSSLVDSIGKWDKIFEKYVLCFENEEEKQEFDGYLTTRQDDISKKINDFYEEKRKELEDNCREICPEEFSSEVEIMVERGVFAEKIAEFFRCWKNGKNNDN